jgi:hypothetical protein
MPADPRSRCYKRKEDTLASRDMDYEAETELMSIVDGLSPEGRASIASLREDQVTQLHFGLGVYPQSDPSGPIAGTVPLVANAKYPTGSLASI